MCEHKNIQKFEALRLYCEKYGFGYIIMDDRENSYEHIDEHNEEFTNLLLSEIHQNGCLRYKVYKKIHVETNASVKNLLTLIKKQKLTFSSPFFIKQ